MLKKSMFVAVAVSFLVSFNTGQAIASSTGTPPPSQQWSTDGFFGCGRRARGAHGSVLGCGTRDRGTVHGRGEGGARRRGKVRNGTPTTRSVKTYVREATAKSSAPLFFLQTPLR